LRVLITGGEGFAGSHLLDLLLGESTPPKVSCLVHPDSDLENLAHATDRIDVIRTDIRDRKAVSDAVARSRPDAVYHLAGIAFVPSASSNPAAVYEVNLLGTLNLLEALRENAPYSSTLLVSSAEVYGVLEPGSDPLTEDDPLRPVNHYGVSKASMELCALPYTRGEGALHLVLVRPFNHIGPRQSPQFVVSSFCRQIAKIEAGLEDPVLRVGNLEARRDFTDVRDVVRGYRILLEKGACTGAYNLSSGRAPSVREVVERIIALAGVDVDLQVESGRLRSTDNPLALGSSAKARKETGWEPKIPLDTSLADTLEYWKKRIN